VIAAMVESLWERNPKQAGAKQDHLQSLVIEIMF